MALGRPVSAQEAKPASPRLLGISNNAATPRRDDRTRSSADSTAVIARYYIGAGVRALFNDPPLATLYGAIRIADFRGRAVSLRPALLAPIIGLEDPYGFNQEFSARLSITADVVRKGFATSFLGGGVAPNFDSSRRMAWMYTVGGEIRVSRSLSLSATGNWVLRPWLSDNKDREAIWGVNYRF